jgi:hypothetical protein
MNDQTPLSKSVELVYISLLPHPLSLVVASVSLLYIDRFARYLKRRSQIRLASCDKKEIPLSCFCLLFRSIRLGKFVFQYESHK